MVKLSRASRYAIVALVCLARKGGRQAKSHEIARAEAIPEKILLKVLRSLVSAQVLTR